jgi:dinuclear metal center YbgI/SA1388 family protein
MQVKHIIEALEELAPLHYAEDFDNTGLLTGAASMKVTGILITLDCLETVVEEAMEKKCNLIVAFHPIIFSGLKHIRPDDYVRNTIIKAIKNDIAIFAIHTALDLAKGGVSYRMGQALGLRKLQTLIPKKGLIKKLVTYVPSDAFKKVEDALFKVGAGSLGAYTNCSFTHLGTGSFMGDLTSNPKIGKKGQLVHIEEQALRTSFLPHLEDKIVTALHDAHPYETVSYEITTLENAYQDIGMGVIGTLPEPLPEHEFLALTKQVYGSKIVRYSLSRKRSITKVAVLGGSGAFAIKNALQAGADAYLTADLKYHDFFQANGMLLCDVGHYESERFTKDILHDFLSKKFSNFAILCAQVQTNPVNYF